MQGTHSTYKKLAVQWLNEALCTLANGFCGGRQFSGKNPALRVAANRYKS